MKNRLFSSLTTLVSTLKESTNLEHEFAQLAKKILLENSLVVGKKEYHLLEIEFYFFHKTIYPDPYSHAKQYPNSVQLKQSVTGSWYFHRFTGMKKYHHTRRGLDLTFGDGEQGKFGGILIRSIKTLNEDQIISGPSRVVGEIINQINNNKELERIAFDTNAGLAFDSTCLLHLKALKHPRNTPIYTCPRHGLSDKNLAYRNKKQRFLTELSIVKKNSSYQLVL